jgi:hypothetical protein
MIGHLPDYRRELARRHVCPTLFVDIPELDKDLGPGLGVGAAVEGRESSRLHLGDMITGVDWVAVIREHQGRIRSGREDVEKLAQ